MHIGLDQKRNVNNNLYSIAFSIQVGSRFDAIYFFGSLRLYLDGSTP